ncbi:hypothetical protein L6164_006625 [Bauhinia variegata]|uniref:Uncharacterized protein n=1 Tax=Bauhinia variegata TaxID=167791 RepID=A0ACB9PU88_BAUVA|nr:hypothetical protein L6164_006625 [Bauhinia variegata]
MAENLNRLSEALFVDSKSLSSHDLIQKLRSDDAIRLGLNSFLSILKRGVEVVGDGRLGLESWDDSQIQAICSIAYAIVSASRSLSGKVSVISLWLI